MADQSPFTEWDPEAMRIRGFTTGIHQIQMLLVVVVLVYVIFAVTPTDKQLPALLGIFVYFVFVAVASYKPLVERHRRWLIAVHTWVMIAFISWVLYYAADLNSPLISLYMLVVIIGALALGMRAALLEVALIAACYLLLIYLHYGFAGFTPEQLARAVAHVGMFLLVGFLTTVLANAIHSANRRMRELATTDSLTGLYNRAAFRDLTRHLHEGAKRTGESFAIVVADMDNLKSINDRLGHDAGDRAIVQLADRIVSTARKADIAARYGGDEFVVFLQGTDRRKATQWAYRLLDSIKFLEVDGVGLSVSLGIAGYPEHGDEIEALLIKADRAMYESKSGGGNSVTVVDEDRKVGSLNRSDVRSAEYPQRLQGDGVES